MTTRKQQAQSTTCNSQEKNACMSVRREDNGSENGMALAELELRKLTFQNPGKFMEDFNPEKSTREMRKIKRRMCVDNVQKNQMYNENGLLLETSEDLCDCLEERCPGCHFPCPKCSSAKCGSQCRGNRRWIFDTVEVEGTGRIRKWKEKSSSAVH